MFRPQIFVSYAHDDRHWFDKGYLMPRLIKSLETLEKADVWYDRQRLAGGDPWRQDIEAAIDRAHLALLLVSTNFIVSEFIQTVELPRIEQRARDEQLIILPILIGHCNWRRLDVLKGPQMIPGDPTPLVEYRESEARWEKVQHDILNDVERQIAKVRGRLNPPPPPKTDRPVDALSESVVAPAAIDADGSASIERELAVPIAALAAEATELVRSVAFKHEGMGSFSDNRAKVFGSLVQANDGDETSALDLLESAASSQDNDLAGKAVCVLLKVHHDPSPRAVKSARVWSVPQGSITRRERRSSMTWELPFDEAFLVAGTPLWLQKYSPLCATSQSTTANSSHAGERFKH